MMIKRENPTYSWRPGSLAILFGAWLILQVGGLFSPGLLDDVDSVYIQIAREMMARHDYVTPMIDGIRFFDKPPLMYWLAAGSMQVFGVHDWAARIPLALGTLALFFAAYALGIRLFRTYSPPGAPDRGGLYAGLALATSVGPYLYTRFYIPDVMLALWMTLGVHLTLVIVERVSPSFSGRERRSRESALLPCLAFAAVLAANLLTKGLIGFLFQIGFMLLYLAVRGQLWLVARFHLVWSSLTFLVLALPWHVLAALRNPAITLPPFNELPAEGGWAWFYLYNEHVARFHSKRVPHDYGLTPVWLFWVYVVIWAMPYAVFLPGAVAEQVRVLWRRSMVFNKEHEIAWTLMIWVVLVLGFFSISNRQEYYSIPALPALALFAAGLMARADEPVRDVVARASVEKWAGWMLLPVTTLVAVVCGVLAITAPKPAAGADLSSLLVNNPELYNVSLGHLFDLTSAAMGLFRGPLLAVMVGMLLVGLGSFAFRRAGEGYKANLTLAAGMIVTLLAAHEGLVRFNPILGSKGLALAINHVRKPGDMILIDGELTAGSTLLFYTGQQVHLVNGRVNGPWFGSFWPDAPQIFETDDSLHALWAGPQRMFLLTYSAKRAGDLAAFGPVHVLAAAGGKTILTNR